jgi:hypothetical protein
MGPVFWTLPHRQFVGTRSNSCKEGWKRLVFTVASNGIFYDITITDSAHVVLLLECTDDTGCKDKQRAGNGGPEIGLWESTLEREYAMSIHFNAGHKLEYRGTHPIGM